MGLRDWFRLSQVGASVQAGPFGVELILQTQEEAAATVDGAVDEVEDLIVQKEAARTALEAAVGSRRAAVIEYDRASKALQDYRRSLEDSKVALSRPYPPLLHQALLMLLPLAEWAATGIALNSAGEFDPYEVVLLPFGFVLGLMVGAHNLGVLLKGMHVSHAVTKYDDAKRRTLPPAEFFGTSPWWRLVALVSAFGVVAASIAALVIRWNVETGDVPAFAFLMIALVLGIAASGESFLWYNPWLETLDQHRRLSDGARIDHESALEQTGAARGEVVATDWRTAHVLPSTRRQLLDMREAAQVNMAALEREGRVDDPMFAVHQQRIGIIDSHLARLEAELSSIPDADADEPA